jgi:hypothetical protein
MANLLYVIAAVGFVVVVSLVWSVKERWPKRPEASIDAFARGLRALAPADGTPERAEAAVSPPAPGRVQARAVEVADRGRTRRAQDEDEDARFEVRAGDRGARGLPGRPRTLHGAAAGASVRAGGGPSERRASSG